MEGEPGHSDEDTQRDDKPVVLWEKCIQQSIFIDLSEDESLHLSDLESSLAFHISQAKSAASEASINLSGRAELSDYDTSSESNVNSQNERVKMNNTGSRVLRVSVQRPNTAQDVPSLNRLYEDPGQNTSDEDHDDLPYDGDLGSHYFNQVPASESNIGQDERDTSYSVPDFHYLHEHIIINKASYELAPVYTEKLIACLDGNATTTEDNDSHKPNEPNNQLKLPSKEELLRSGRLIEAETLPEVSLLESMDETVFSMTNPINRGSFFNSETYESGCSEQKSKIADQNVSVLETEVNDDGGTSSVTESCTPKSTSICSNHQDIAESDEEKGDIKDPKVPLLRTRSFNEMKYGQGQVHYPLPDFSKVAPKVKIPKSPRWSSKPSQQLPSTIHRAHSSPEILEVLSRVLEDSPERPCAFKDQDPPESPALVQHLQAKYDKLLAKYAEAENLIDQMRLGTNPPPSELLLCFEEGQDCLAEGSLDRPLSWSTFASSDLMADKLVDKVQTANQCTDKEEKILSSVLPEVGPSDGELMTAELTNITSHFMHNVEEFKFNVSNMSITIREQQMILRSLMEAQDQLERKYMSKKEEHRALEMQIYMGICRNTGTFDPDRLVEGDIFRIGMFLEDVKEMIDKNVCEQISPPQSSSTPLPYDFHVKPNLLYKSTPSPPLSLHEDQGTAFSIVAHDEMEKRENKQKATETNASHVDTRLKQTNEYVNTGHSRMTVASNCYSRSSHTSQKGGQTPPAEDVNQRGMERSVLSKEIGHSNILAYFRATSASPEESLSVCQSTRDSALNPECDLGHCVSSSVEVSCSSEAPKDCDSVSKPPINTSASQRNVSPETDSGFGSSYLNQSASGSFQQNLNESFHSQNDHIRSSESEGSCSNLQTTIQPIHLITPQWSGSKTSVRLQPHGALDPVKQWLKSTTNQSPFTEQGTKHHHTSEPILSSMMDTGERGRSMCPCSCNSEAILALQSEVFRLKKDMKEGFVQLPYLADKLDDLTSKYRHERMAKTTSRSHKKSTTNSNIHSPIIGLNLCNGTSSPVKLDWISTDIATSRSKGTVTEDTTASELQFDSSPVGRSRGSNFRYLDSGLQSPGAVLSSEAFAARWPPLYSTPIHKPLLQVNYGSSSSLPASYKLREYPLQYTAYNRKKSTQSDTALLPSNVFFQQTLSPLSAPSKLGTRTSIHSGSKEEQINRALDQAIEVARSLKKTSDRMAKNLSADLTKAKIQRRLYSIQPLRGRKHHAL